MEKRVVISRLTPRPAWPPNRGGVTVTESISARSIFFPDTVQLLSLSSPILFSSRKWTPLFLPFFLSSLLSLFSPPSRREENGRWTTRRCRLTFSKFHPVLTYSCLEEESGKIFSLYEGEKKRKRKKKIRRTRGKGERNVTKTMPLARLCSRTTQTTFVPFKYQFKAAFATYPAM